MQRDEHAAILLLMVLQNRAMTRGNASPDPFSVWTKRGFPPSAGLYRCWRGGLKSVKLLHEETSSHFPTPARRPRGHSMRWRIPYRPTRAAPPLRKLQQLENLSAWSREQLVFLRGLFRSHVSDELDLVES